MFVIEESLQCSLKGVNETNKRDIAKFLAVLTYFMMQCAYVRWKQEKMMEAVLLFDILHKLA